MFGCPECPLRLGVRKGFSTATATDIKNGLLPVGAGAAENLPIVLKKLGGSENPEKANRRV
jgi:hypothetical protein